MTQYEMLSRGSMFAVASKPHFKKHQKFHFVTAAHILQPFNFMHLYPGDQHSWLSFVTEVDTQQVLQIREFQTGKTLEEFHLSQRVFTLPKIDLAVVHLLDEDNFLQSLQVKYHEKLNVLELEACRPDPQLEIHGHDLNLCSSGEEVLVPTTLKGTLNFEDGSRYFLKTEVPAVMGLCGGPVIDMNSTTCVGVVEALVPPLTTKDNLTTQFEFRRRVENNTVVVKASVIKSLIDHVENTLLSGSQI
eukprot:TRINITY_DN12024_c0_g1_i1.p1 TRINITY_DN12024_c0_g1~~TRINITY_DN12024_c0_g1_i1.p1  ORF type:complete len:289 (+),score=62.90 TRINITY_DN12024_c0_g1_i1:132-869(+)